MQRIFVSLPACFRFHRCSTHDLLFLPSPVASPDPLRRFELLKPRHLGPYATNERRLFLSLSTAFPTSPTFLQPLLSTLFHPSFQAKRLPTASSFLLSLRRTCSTGLEVSGCSAAAPDRLARPSSAVPALPNKLAPSPAPSSSPSPHRAHHFRRVESSLCTRRLSEGVRSQESGCS